MINLGWYWNRDGNSILLRRGLVKGADADTFEPLSSHWARDRSRIYAGNKPLRGADRDSFVVLNELYAKDCQHVYYLSGKIKDADAATFEAVGPDCDTTYCRGFARDARTVFHYVFTIGKPVPLKGANPQTFRALGHGFGSDGNAVFYERARIPGARFDQWRLFPPMHSTSGKSVYFLNRKVDGADAATIETLPGWGTMTRDATGFYEQDRRVDPREFWDEFRNFFIFRGVVRGATVYNYRSEVVPDGTTCNPRLDQMMTLEVECSEWLQRPAIAVDNAPEVGGTTKFNTHNLCDLAEWKGRDWIWFFHPHESSQVGALPVLITADNWRFHAPAEEIDRVRGLIAEAGHA